MLQNARYRNLGGRIALVLPIFRQAIAFPLGLLNVRMVLHALPPLSASTHPPHPALDETVSEHVRE
jgi:hypothetical protein